MTENPQNVLSLINEKQKKNKLLTIRSRTKLLKIFTTTNKYIYRRIRVQTNEMRIVLFIRIKYCNEKRYCVFCIVDMSFIRVSGYYYIMLVRNLVDMDDEDKNRARILKIAQKMAF